MHGVRSAIVDRKQARRNKFIGWGVFAVIVLGVILANSGSKSGSSYDTSYSTNYDYSDYEEVPIDVTAPTEAIADAIDAAADAEAEALETAAEEAAESAESADETTYADEAYGWRMETPPAPYQSNPTVSLSELRYCKRQMARLEAVQYVQMSNPQIDRFNAAVDDYNSRCSSFRYHQSDMNTVDREIAADQMTIRSEALAIIGGA